MRSHTSSLGLALALAVGPLGVLWANRGFTQAEVYAASQAPATDPAAMRGLTGTASCSMRGCHGSLEPRGGQLIQHNELATWLNEDKHARAFQVLADERSQQIVRKLGLKPAFEELRCLACHTTPAAADGASDFLKEERRGGVGCEACHGGAEKWLDEHAANKWDKLTVERKADYGMTWTGDLATRARACVGCHVGAPADERSPARDVNHDLIAAGHPRLNFEMAAFMGRMPAHWRLEKERGRQAETWAVGQIVAAAQALALLEYRTKVDEGAPQKPWPEFAEYDCFACHHELRQPSWRQMTELSDRKPGTLAWGSWNWPVTLALAQRDRNQAVVEAAARLRRRMEKPNPDRVRVGMDAKAVAELLADWLVKVRDRKYTKNEIHELSRALADAGPKLSASGWDATTQVYFALAALDTAADANTARHAALQELYRALAFPPPSGKTEFDSPLNYRSAPFDGSQLSEVFRRIMASDQR